MLVADACIRDMHSQSHKLIRSVMRSTISQNQYSFNAVAAIRRLSPDNSSLVLRVDIYSSSIYGLYYHSQAAHQNEWLLQLRLRSVGVVLIVIVLPS